MKLVGHPEVVDEAWFASGRERAKRAEMLDGMVGTWIAARDADDVVAAFEEAQAAIAPIYDIEDIFADPQYQALDSITTVDDPDLGAVRMQNVLFRMSQTPGSIRWTGRGIGADNQAVFGDELGIDDEELQRLRKEGIV